MQTNTNIAMHRCPCCKRRTINYCYDDDDDDDDDDEMSDGCPVN